MFFHCFVSILIYCMIFMGPIKPFSNSVDKTQTAATNTLSSTLIYMPVFFCFFLLFILAFYLIVDSGEADRKHEDREGVTCNKGVAVVWHVHKPLGYRVHPGFMRIHLFTASL